MLCFFSINITLCFFHPAFCVDINSSILHKYLNYLMSDSESDSKQLS